jgi:hypothetical protein
VTLVNDDAIICKVLFECKSKLYSQLEFYYCIPVNCWEKEMRKSMREEQKECEQENGEKKTKS